MSDIVNKIKEINGLDHLEGCSTAQVEEAEDALGLKFPAEYVDYVREYGAISFYGTEWTGLNVDGYLNTVEATKEERALNPSFPEGFFVLENLRVDASFAIVNEQGQVFLSRFDDKELFCESISEYLDDCIQRRERVEG